LLWSDEFLGGIKPADSLGELEKMRVVDAASQQDTLPQWGPWYISLHIILAAHRKFTCVR
jgi:hypothetical protein